MVRAHIRFDTMEEANRFVSVVNSDGTTDKWTLTTNTMDYKVSARSLLGVLYMMTEHNENCYLINESHPDEQFSSWVDAFRVIG